MAKLALMREGFGLPSLPEQQAALLAAGIPASEFTRASGHVYIDRKRYKSHREATTFWLDMMQKQVRPGDVIYVHSPVVFAAGERSIRERLTFLIEKKAAAVFDCSIGRLIRLTPDSAAVLDFQKRGAKAMQDAKQRKATRARARVAYEGQSDWEPRHRRAAKQAWVSLPREVTNELLEIEAARLAGMPAGSRIPYRTIFRWSKAGRGWAPRGSAVKRRRT